MSRRPTRPQVPCSIGTWGELDDIARSLPPGAELDDVPLLQRLARRNALAGVRCTAEFFDLGVPEGYRQAVAAFAASGGLSGD